MRPLPRFSVAAFGVALVLVGSACGDDDIFPRDEFVSQVVEMGVTEPVANCAYDQIKGNKSIMAELRRAGGPNSNISSKVTDEMAPILARCLLAAEKDAKSSTTTTTEKG